MDYEKEPIEWHKVRRNSGHLRRTIRAIVCLSLVTGLVVGAFIYQTIHLGREEQLIRHLEEQLDRVQGGDDHANVDKRALAWFLGAALWTGNQIFSFYGLASSCKDFSSSAGTAALCVWGAISTAATFIGVAAHGASTVKIIHDRLAQNGISIGGWKRDAMVLDAEAQMSSIFRTTVSLDGFVPHHHPKIARMNLTEGTYWPVFHLYNHHNSSMHLTMTAWESDHAVMTLGFGHKSQHNGTLSKRESYNNEYFTNGGIDYTDCFNAAQDTYLLNEDSDYQQMDADVECYFPDLSNTWGAEVQLYDNNIKGTIGSGSIAAYRGSDHASSISAMPGCPNSLPASSSCEAA